MSLVPPAPLLREDLSPGDVGHIGDHEAIHKALDEDTASLTSDNDLSGTNAFSGRFIVNGAGNRGTWAEMQAQVAPVDGQVWYAEDQGIEYRYDSTQTGVRKWRRSVGDPNEIWATDFGAVPTFTYPSGAVMTANVAAFIAATAAARTNLGGGSEFATAYTVVCPGTKTGVVYFLNAGNIAAGIVRFEGNKNGLATGILGWSNKVWIDGTSIPNNDPVFLLDRSFGPILQRSAFKDIGVAGHCTAIKMDDEGIADNAGLWLDNVDLYVDTVASADNTPLLLVDCFWIIWNEGGVRAATDGKASVTLRSGQRGYIPYLMSITNQIWVNGSIKLEHNSTTLAGPGGSWNLDNITTEGQVAGDPFIELTAGGSAVDNALIQAVRINNCQRADAADAAGAFLKINATISHKFVLNNWRITNCSPYTNYYIDINGRSTLGNVEVNGVAANTALFTPTSNLADCFKIEYVTGSTHTIIDGFGSESLTATSSDGIRFQYGGETAHRSLFGPLGILLGGGAGEFDVSLRRAAAHVWTTGAADTFKTGQNVTGSRPSAGAVGAGAQFYDTTLGKPIWSNGSVWKDAAGTTV